MLKELPKLLGVLTLASYNISNIKNANKTSMAGGIGIFCELLINVTKNLRGKAL